jgi:hypothetical protein
VFEKLYQNAPLIVLNSFSGEGLHMKLMASMFQNMFPTINITKVRNKNLREAVAKASMIFMCTCFCTCSLPVEELLKTGGEYEIICTKDTATLWVN